MKKIFLAFIILTGLSTISVKAQGQMFSLQYSVGFGMGDTHDFISKTSFRGISFEYRKLITPNHAIGGEISYNFFYEKKDYATYTDDNQSISGIQYRYLNALPVLASYDYYFKPNNKYNPFIGAGIGCNILYQRLDMGLYSFTNDAVQFAFRPEAGILMKVNPNLDLIFAAKYFVSSNGNDMDGQNYLALNFGFVF